jgi:hypothetical protein
MFAFSVDTILFAFSVDKLKIEIEGSGKPVGDGRSLF